MFLNPQKNLVGAGVHDGMHVAEFGVGAGYYVYPLCSLVGNSGLVYAFDINQELLSRVKKEATEKGINNVRFISANVEKESGTMLQNETLDMVLIANTFFQIENKKNALMEAKRILRKGGRLIIVEWSDSYAGLGPHQNVVIKKDDAKKIIEAEGFSFFKEIPAGDHHYGLIFMKQKI